MVETILHQSSWARSALNQRIELYEYRSALQERPILMIGGVHGDEPEGVQLAKDLIVWLQKNHMQGCKFHSWFLIPCLNPDGFSKNERTNGNGVDLNRNFPSRDWVPDIKAERYHPGVQAGSEPEVKALVDLIHRVKPAVIIHFHSWKPCVVYTGAPGKQTAELLGEGTGYSIAEDIGYPTPGSLGQYGWLEHQTPVICIEAKAGAPLSSIWPTFGKGLQKLLCVNSIPQS